MHSRSNALCQLQAAANDSAQGLTRVLAQQQQTAGDFAGRSSTRRFARRKEVEHGSKQVSEHGQSTGKQPKDRAGWGEPDPPIVECT